LAIWAVIVFICIVPVTFRLSLAAFTLCTFVFFFPFIWVVVIKLATTHAATLYSSVKEVSLVGGLLRV
jgi:cobalamin biosynthesis protein CobD/CbiB